MPHLLVLGDNIVLHQVYWAAPFEFHTPPVEDLRNI